MVRFLRTTCEVFESHDELDRYIIMERLLSLCYMPSSICMAVGSLARCGVIPYAKKQEWLLLLISSVYLTMANGRDLNHSIRCMFLWQYEPPSWHGRRSRRERRHRHRYRRTRYKYVERNGTGIRAQMQMCAAVTLTIGALSLINASVIALIGRHQQDESELCRRQYAAAFGLMLIGSAANTAGSISNTYEMLQVEERVTNMRMVVGFQHVIASAAYCVGGVLSLPSMRPIDTSTAFHASLVLASSLVGGAFAVLASVVNLFHTSAFLWWQEEEFEKAGRTTKKRRRRRRRRYLRDETTAPLKYGEEELEEIELLDEDEDEDEDGYGYEDGYNSRGMNEAEIERDDREKFEKVVLVEEGKDVAEWSSAGDDRRNSGRSMNDATDGGKGEGVGEVYVRKGPAGRYEGDDGGATGEYQRKGVLERLRDVVRFRSCRWLWNDATNARCSDRRVPNSPSISTSASACADVDTLSGDGRRMTYKATAAKRRTCTDLSAWYGSDLDYA